MSANIMYPHHLSEQCQHWQRWLNVMNFRVCPIPSRGRWPPEVTTQITDTV